MTDAPRRILGGLTSRQFLSEYWQKQPLLVRGALPIAYAPITPEELAGIAMEDDAVARVILVRGANYPWELRHGPFLEEDFANLGDADWTLLVQEVEQWHPGAANLLDEFRFIPNWRVDDLMVSYATPGGGVGAHIDNYDVFLLQGLGRRRWRIARDPVQHERLVPDLDVSVLAEFEPDEDWVLDPGDLLYLPPRIAHEGVALDECMTFSVGFRAPSTVEMIRAYLHHASESIDSGFRYADPELSPSTEPGLIDDAALQRLREMVMAPLSDPDRFRTWFGKFVTEPKRGRLPDATDETHHPAEIAEILEMGGVLRRTSVGHFAHIRNPDGSTSLFVGGSEYRLDAELAPAVLLIDGTGTISRSSIGRYAERVEFMMLITDLVNTGFLIPDLEAL